ncbi:MAG: acyl-CoA dehydrogenase family protein [Acidimicrobiales bacterium]
MPSTVPAAPPPPYRAPGSSRHHRPRPPPPRRRLRDGARHGCRFADQKLAPIAEHIHRENGDIPEEIIEGLAEMGAFGLSIPAEYGGYGEGGEGEYIGMVVATEALRAARSARRQLADHPARDPRPGAHRRRHRGAEAQWLLASHRRGLERRGRHRARLRLRR